jgi:hypothetical protein
VPREQGQDAARENAALVNWPLCEESNLANRVRSPMPGRRDRENRENRAVSANWQARSPRRGTPKNTTGRQIGPVSPAGFEPAFPD